MDRDITIILGKTGGGKSCFSKLLTCSHPRLYVYDPARSYAVEFYRVPQLYEVVEQHGYFVKNKENFRVGGIEPESCVILGNSAFISGDCVYVIEEAASLFPVGLSLNQRGESAEQWNWLRRLVFFGRHRACSMVVIAQRAVSIPPALRSQATRIVSFQQHEADDTAWLSSFFSVQAYGDLPKLGPLECVDWWRGTERRYSIKAQCESRLGIKFDSQSQAMIDSQV